jgi:CHAD domain-containing protein
MADSPAAAAEILSRSPEEGARRLALAYLDQAAAALPRLHDDADTEALHDLRVALRRLRSCLRSYAPQLGGSVTHKLERRLRKLASATGPGRDVEVQIAWLAARRGEIARHHRAGLAWLLAHLGERRDAAYADLRGEMAAELTPFAARLREHLAVYRAEVRLDDARPPAFADAAADALRRHGDDLTRRLARLHAADQVAAAHRARISAKRLRYLADPLAPLAAPPPPGTAAAPAPADTAGNATTGNAAAARHRGRRPLLGRLKALQDLLGELHDAHVLEEELSAALATVAAERAGRLFDATLAIASATAASAAASPAADRAVGEALRQEGRRPRESGILALARLNRARRDRLFAELAASWQEAERESLAAAVEELAAALQQAAGEAPAPPRDAEPPNVQ